jgi:hypothetical protein
MRGRQCPVTDSPPKMLDTLAQAAAARRSRLGANAANAQCKMHNCAGIPWLGLAGIDEANRWSRSTCGDK